MEKPDIQQSSIINSLQAEIVRHLPILIFDRRRQDHVTEGTLSAAAQTLSIWLL
jgi:hypothetical protein